ncbi:hypothetical protein [Thiothrix lacustris]|uniref:hypothetical protein n=1 Tax=Thiothrix lacustris TaxID=525917 RepID=UPI0027E569E6|nr:hypothetical protein [Thiothrix lacustris]WMP19452.1 hypothetical protein RCS87_19370 [Thiothrix lacustris]
MAKEVFRALDALAIQIGEKEAIELFQFALPAVIERQHKLEQHLGAGEWADAAHFAHKTISSVRLYGSNRLENLLRQAKEAANEQVDVTLLRRELSEEFEVIIKAVREWLAIHSSGVTH